VSRLTAAESLARLLAIVPWVAAQDAVPIDEICRRFDLTRDELLADLDIVFLVGVHPFTPDQLIEVRIDDDRVSIDYADYFARPLSLTAEQALALVTAGASMLAIPGADPEGPLARGLDKLAGVLGLDRGRVDIDLGDASGDTLAQLQAAVADHRSVRIEYYAFGRDEYTERTLDPYAVRADRGQWYVSGWCHSAEAERTFRVDRITNLETLSSDFEPPAEPVEPEVFASPDGLPRVVLHVDPGHDWLADQYPTDHVERAPDGAMTITLPVAAEAWLERLLLQLGPHAGIRSIDPPLSATLGSDAAERVLARYRASTGT
jgi:proteasome accessory factor C